VYQVPLTEKSRGKLTLGDVTLLFQFVTPPPLPAKPQLPAIIQSGWMKGFDWVYSTILLLSFISHSGFVYWCHKKGAMTGSVKLEYIDTRFAKLIVQKPAPRPKKIIAKTDDKDKKKDKNKKGDKDKNKPKKRAVAKKKSSKKPGRKPGKKLSPEDQARAKAKRRQEIAKQVSNRGLLQALIGTKGTSGSGSTFDAIGDGNVIDKVSQATKGLKGGIGVADGSSRTTRRRGAKGGSRALATGSGVGKGPVGGGGSGIKTKRKIRRISGRMKIQKIDQEEGGNLDSGSLSRMIRRKSGQIRFCYERELRKNTSLRGKISLRVVVLGRGRVRKVEVEDNELNSAVASCLKRRIKSWRFPKPKGGENATVLIPFFFQPSS
jgi:outer membrane biosynthesis protein TonB